MKIFKPSLFLIIILPQLSGPLMAQPPLPGARKLTLDQLSHERISFRGIGPIRIGMATRQLKESLDGEIVIEDQSIHEVAYFKEDSSKFTAMIEMGVVTILFFKQKGFLTVSGIQVGDPDMKVRRTYGERLKISEHHYVSGGYFMSLHSENEKVALTFETDGKVVTNIRVGLLPGVEYATFD
jgi:hypothetical protein